MALSANGNTALAGGPGYHGAAGAAWVFTRTGGVWSQQGGKLAGTGAAGDAYQGCSVALSADGNTAIVGGYTDNNFVGSAWVYTRTGGVWSQQAGKLVGPDANGLAYQGQSVSLSADGNTAMAGGPNDNQFAGAAWVYTRMGGVSSQQGGKLVVAGAFESSLGHSVALSADGNTALAGGSDDGGSVGAAWVFVIPPSINTGGVVNGASFLSGIAPGTWISIFGSNLSTTMPMWSYPGDFVGNNLPKQLDGVSVTVDGKPAYVYYISPTQLNVLVPSDTAQGPVAVQVTNAQGKSNAVNADQGTYSPALFMSGRYVAGVGQVKPGDIIVLYGTGFGATDPASPIGQIISTPAPLANLATVRIGGLLATKQYTGIVGAGFYQFNVVVPNVSNGDNAVVMDIGGSSTQPNAFLAVQR